MELYTNTAITEKIVVFMWRKKDLLMEPFGLKIFLKNLVVALPSCQIIFHAFGT